MKITLQTTLKEIRELLQKEDEGIKKQLEELFNSSNIGSKSSICFFGALILGGINSDASDVLKGIFYPNQENNGDGTFSRNAGTFIKSGATSFDKEINGKLVDISEKNTLWDIEDGTWINWKTKAGMDVFKDSNGNYIFSNVDSKKEAMKKIVEFLIGKSGNSKGDSLQMKKKIEELIKDGGCRQVIFTGAPGTGKTYYAKEIAKNLGAVISEEIAKNGSKKEIKFRLVQFHPSYDYTDFVEGLRPITVTGSTGSDEKEVVTFAKLDGSFKKFCREVVDKNKKNNGSSGNSSEEQKKELYFFIIDEINRANLSKVFGELMFGLERDKRGEDNRFQTQYANLPTYHLDSENKWTPFTDAEDVFKDGFYIPENVVIIGTMNDIDRSVDSMDFALRRRFEWREFRVTKEMLKEAFEAKDDNENPVYGQVIADKSDDLAKRIMTLNEYISSKGGKYGLNEQYFISQGQFSGLSYAGNDYNKLCEHVWNYRIESLLREYLRGEDNIQGFIDEAKDSFTGNE